MTNGAPLSLVVGWRRDVAACTAARHSRSHTQLPLQAFSVATAGKCVTHSFHELRVLCCSAATAHQWRSHALLGTGTVLHDSALGCNPTGQPHGEVYYTTLHHVTSTLRSSTLTTELNAWSAWKDLGLGLSLGSGLAGQGDSHPGQPWPYKKYAGEPMLSSSAPMHPVTSPAHFSCKVGACPQRRARGILHHWSLVPPVPKPHRGGSVYTRQQVVFRHTCSTIVPRAQVSMLHARLTPNFAPASATSASTQRLCFLCRPVAPRATQRKPTCCLYV